MSIVKEKRKEDLHFSNNDSFKIQKISCEDFGAFEIRLGNCQLPRLLPKEICIFSKVRQQIIAETKLP